MPPALGSQLPDVASFVVVVGVAVGVGDVDALVSAGADAVALAGEDLVRAARDRVDVPIVAIDPSGGVVTPDGVRHDAVGPFVDGRPGWAVGSLTTALLDGARVVLSEDVRRDRRVVGIVERLISARVQT